MQGTPYPHVTPRLTPHQVNQLLAHLLRVPELFPAARHLLKPESFPPGLPEVKVIWQSALELARRHGPAVLFDSAARARNLLETEALAHAAAHPEEVGPSSAEALE